MGLLVFWAGLVFVLESSAVVGWRKPILGAWRWCFVSVDLEKSGRFVGECFGLFGLRWVRIVAIGTLFL